MNPVSPSLNLGEILVKQHEFKKLVNWRRKMSPLFLQKNFREKDCCPHETVLFIAQSCLTLQPCGQHTRLPSPSPSSRSVLKFMSVESMMPSNHVSICCSLLLPSIFPSIRVFSIESTLHQVAKILGASASASVLPMNIQDLFPLGLPGGISLQSKGLSRVFSNTTVWKHQFFSAQPSFWSNSHICT